jgi:hypothetical protein
MAPLLEAVAGGPFPQIRIVGLGECGTPAVLAEVLASKCRRAALRSAALRPARATGVS